MPQKTYSIFGAGPAGLYTAWRLLGGGTTRTVNAHDKQLKRGDTLELYDWGNYNFSDTHPGDRQPGGRICTWFYADDKTHSYVEMGGMRYAPWDARDLDQPDYTAPGHRLVSTVIERTGLDQFSVPFNITSNTLLYLRSRNIYAYDITSTSPVPYNADRYGSSGGASAGEGIVEDLAVQKNKTRAEWNKFYENGTIDVDPGEGAVFTKGALLRGIGYWNLMYDKLGSEGYDYAADAGGYTSNVINAHAAYSILNNDDFDPASRYATLTIGYSGMFGALFAAIVDLAATTGVKFDYLSNTRLHSILVKRGKGIEYAYATRQDPWRPAGRRRTDAAWLAMPRYSVELVAQGSRYAKVEDGDTDVLNHTKVRLYLESVIMQPSYKIGMFFGSPWWSETAQPPPPYPALLTGYVVTKDVVGALIEGGFPKPYCEALSKSNVYNSQYQSTTAFVKDVEAIVQNRLSVVEEALLLRCATRNTMGPSISDTPIRMAVYFGDNATAEHETAVYGMLASYDDEQYVDFWKTMELEPDQDRTIPTADDVQPLEGPRRVPERMERMLRKQLAELHFGPNSTYDMVPKPLESRFMDWSYPPFGAGYHVWAAHCNMGDVQQKIRKPTLLVDDFEVDADIFIVGSAYSDDQAWVEGAFCTAESVLNDFFAMDPIIDNANYPFISSSE